MSDLGYWRNGSVLDSSPKGAKHRVMCLREWCLRECVNRYSRFSVRVGDNSISSPFLSFCFARCEKLV